MSDVIFVTDRKQCGEDFLLRLERLAAAHPAGIILREKDLSEAEYRRLAAGALEICSRYSVPCILHGFAETAASLGADAIHLPLGKLEAIDPELKRCFKTIGASCHSVEDAVKAMRLGCTYITAGHVFETECKRGLKGRGLGFLKSVCEAVNVPVLAIGGVSSDNAYEVRRAGAAGICVMSGAMRCTNPVLYLASFGESGMENEAGKTRR